MGYYRTLANEGFKFEDIITIDSMIQAQIPEIEFDTATGNDNNYFDFVRLSWKLAPKGQWDRTTLLNKIKKVNKAFQFLALQFISGHKKFKEQGLELSYYSLECTLTIDKRLVYVLSLKDFTYKYKNKI